MLNTDETANTEVLTSNELAGEESHDEGSMSFKKMKWMTLKNKRLLSRVSGILCFAYLIYFICHYFSYGYMMLSERVYLIAGFLLLGIGLVFDKKTVAGIGAVLLSLNGGYSLVSNAKYINILSGARDVAEIIGYLLLAILFLTKKMRPLQIMAPVFYAVKVILNYINYISIIRSFSSNINYTDLCLSIIVNLLLTAQIGLAAFSIVETTGKTQEKHSMKWHYFLMVTMILGGIWTILNGISIAAGTQYGVQARYIYIYYPSLKTADILYGVVVICLGVYQFVVRSALNGFRQNAIQKLVSLYVLSIGANVLYSLAVSNVDGSVILSTLISTGCAVPIDICNYIYYKKRIDLFVN